MKKSHESRFNTNWYELWMQQSKDFFELSEKYLKEIQDQKGFINPEENLKQINKWLETLKEQWQFTELTEEQRVYQMYFSMMAKMYNDATELLLEEWIKRSRADNPIKNFRELYELWLHCCHEIYQKTINSKAYQDAYGKFMNAAISFWQSTLPK